MTRFRFTLRELFLVTVIVGLTLGWWVDRARFVAERDQLKRKMTLQFFDDVSVGP